MTAMQMVSDKPQMEHELMQFTLSLDRIRHWPRRRHYTSGVEQPATRTGSYWLIDLIASAM